MATKVVILNWDAVLTLEPPRGSGVDGPFSLRCYAYRWKVANGTAQPYTAWRVCTPINAEEGVKMVWIYLAVSSRMLVGCKREETSTKHCLGRQPRPVESLPPRIATGSLPLSTASRPLYGTASRHRFASLGGEGACRFMRVLRQLCSVTRTWQRERAQQASSSAVSLVEKRD